jgi:hypothetical protein
MRGGLMTSAPKSGMMRNKYNGMVENMINLKLLFKD